MITVELDDGTRVESELIFLALDRPQDVKKLRGVQATGFWLNETKELSRATVDMADLRHGRYPSMAVGDVDCTYHGMIGDSNAWDEDHWLFETISSGTTPDGWSFFRQPGGVLKTTDGWVENPHAENLHNLPPDYYIAGMAGKREDWIAVNLANNYGVVQEGKSVWPEFIDLVHTAPKELRYDGRFPLYVGIDFGLTPAAVFVQRTPMGQYQVIEEIVTENMGASRLAVLIKERLAAADYSTLTVTGDPAGDQRAQTDERTPFDILATNGLSAEPADTNDPLIRIEAVAQQLSRMTMDGKPRLIISPTCKKLRKAMAGGYCYRRVQVAGDDKYHDKPDKNMSSHIADALQYCVLDAGCGDSVVGNSNWSQKPFDPQNFMSKGLR